MNALSEGTCLEHVEFYSIEWDSAGLVLHLWRERAPSRLRSLTLGDGNCDKDAVVEWLLSCRPVPPIEALRLSLICKAPTPSMCACSGPFSEAA